MHVHRQSRCSQVGIFFRAGHHDHLLLLPDMTFTVDWALKTNDLPSYVLVEHSKGHSGSLHEGCRALQVLQAAEKRPRHRTLRWPEVVV